MSNLCDLPCDCNGEPLERVRYFPRQLLTADDMRLEQEYFRQKMRRHNRYLHGWGVVCGASVEPIDDPKHWRVRVCPGYAVAPQGDEILIDHCVDVDLKLGATPEPCTVRWPCPPTGEMPGNHERLRKVYIAVRYAECQSRPVKVHPAGCGCDESACEYSRTRESFEIKVLWALPESHTKAAADDKAWCQQLHLTSSEELKRRLMFPAPPCPECELDPWVVLATVMLPTGEPGGTVGGAPAGLQVFYEDRRVLLGTQRLQTAMLCMA
jgi:hypothetical protein